MLFDAVDLTRPLGRELVAHEGSLQSWALWTGSRFVRVCRRRGYPVGFSSFLFLSRRNLERRFYGRRGPGILSVLLSTLVFDLFFLPPQHSIAIQLSS
jgi:hypothetical protein